ncbi:MAG: hypothetical protein HDS38_07345 [Bacteroides sp.]|nr:hypothetical protein [Bacteroides sp.]
MAILRKICILKDALIGYLIKWKIDLRGAKLSFDSDLCEIPVVVSLTSYGRRVSSVVYYALVSILNQTVKPQRIILWLDDTWSKKTLPKKLLSLERFGVEYKFCRDLKSYKKLLPTLNEISEYPIVTVDDDVMYEPNFLKSLYDSYLAEPDKIHCTHAVSPILKSENQFESYIKWPEYIKNDSHTDYIFPIGEGGVLYPPKSLYKDVTDFDLALSLCPNADDIWFWIMALKNGTKHKVVDLKKVFYSFDALYQFLHKGSALTHSNAKKNKNDEQLKQVVSYYKMKFKY